MLVLKGILSLLWVGAAAQDLKTRRMGNLLTIPSAALALGYRVGQGLTGEYLAFMVGGWVTVLIIWRVGLFGGGDAKLLLALLAWRPGIETWLLVAALVAVLGLMAIAWRGLKKNGRAQGGYPLGGAIALAGLAMLWMV